ncbi:sugar transferase [Niallia taxi]|uniref:sugar transferase n=1 Tax=Niallia taxi TaxID=2499688 RepID=UPI002E1D62FE|nr:sugar transferase [Niallia taxi]
MGNVVKEDVLSKNQSIVSNNVSKRYLITKRYMDLIGAFLGLAILSILFIVIALFIKLEDPKGKVFFKQKRIGLNGKEFYMFKFRSMSSDAEDRLSELLKHNEVQGAMFKIKDDPRVTKTGRFIRKTSIDELPQLYNVLRGDMSLVGPRPPLPREVMEYTSYDKQRLLVVPGCTGLWQISGRSNIGFHEMVELDLRYIAKRSLLNDMLIIFKTVRLLFGSKDAY